MKASRARVFFSCFLRSYMINAAYNPRGLQNIGFLYAIEPGLAAIYGPGEGLRKARMRYAGHYNCHPFFTPLLLGIFLRMEAAIAEKRLDGKILESLKDTTANTLSAIGDSFFNGSLLGAWALSAGCLILAGMPFSALALTLFAFLALQACKFASFIIGVRTGMASLFVLKRLDLINWGDRIKCINAALLSAFLWLALPEARPLVWGGAALYLLLAGWVVGRVHAPRVFVALVLLAATVALHVSGLFGHIPGLPGSL